MYGWKHAPHDNVPAQQLNAWAELFRSGSIFSTQNTAQSHVRRTRIHTLDMRCYNDQHEASGFTTISVLCLVGVVGMLDALSTK